MIPSLPLSLDLSLDAMDFGLDSKRRPLTSILPWKAKILAERKEPRSFAVISRAQICDPGTAKTNCFFFVRCFSFPLRVLSIFVLFHRILHSPAFHHLFLALSGHKYFLEAFPERIVPRTPGHSVPAPSISWSS
jgi:hypothetical protein